jgi:hypothetical protein
MSAREEARQLHDEQMKKEQGEGRKKGRKEGRNS